MTVFVGCPEGCRYHTASAVYDLVEFSFHSLDSQIDSNPVNGEFYNRFFITAILKSVNIQIVINITISNIKLLF